MRTVGGFSIALLLVVPAAFTQTRGVGGNFRGGVFGNPQPFMTGGFGSVLYPGGTWATVPGTYRQIPSVINPGGGGPHLVVPGAVTDPTLTQRLASQAGRNFRRAPFAGGNNFGNRGGFGGGRGFGNGGTAVVGLPYAVPVYVPGYGYGYDYGYGDNGAYPPPDAVPPQAPAQQPPNVIVIYPSGQQPGMAPGMPYGQAAPQPGAEPSAPEEQAQPTMEPSHYLIALKDHTVYAAVAYWVDGDTLHYFTNSNTHNQVSLSLVDRPLTERLNRESGIDFKLPPAKAAQQ
jgi:hypothetical protein